MKSLFYAYTLVLKTKKKLRFFTGTLQEAQSCSQEDYENIYENWCDQLNTRIKVGFTCISPYSPILLRLLCWRDHKATKKAASKLRKNRWGLKQTKVSKYYKGFKFKSQWTLFQPKRNFSVWAGTLNLRTDFRIFELHFFHVIRPTCILSVFPMNLSSNHAWP